MNITNYSRPYNFGSMAHQNRHVLRERDGGAETYRPSVKEDVSGADRVGAGASVWDEYEKMANPAKRPTAVSAEGTERETEQESETKSEIIVKPDGSKVLVMTMRVGGMQTQMSLEISKPTNMLDDHASLEDDGEGMADTQEEMAADEDLGCEGGI